MNRRERTLSPVASPPSIRKFRRAKPRPEDDEDDDGDDPGGVVVDSSRRRNNNGQRTLRRRLRLEEARGCERPIDNGPFRPPDDHSFLEKSEGSGGYVEPYDIFGEGSFFCADKEEGRVHREDNASSSVPSSASSSDHSGDNNGRCCASLPPRRRRRRHDDTTTTTTTTLGSFSSSEGRKEEEVAPAPPIADVTKNEELPPRRRRRRRRHSSSNAPPSDEELASPPRGADNAGKKNEENDNRSGVSPPLARMRPSSSFPPQQRTIDGDKTTAEVSPTSEKMADRSCERSNSATTTGASRIIGGGDSNESEMSRGLPPQQQQQMHDAPAPGSFSSSEEQKEEEVASPSRADVARNNENESSWSGVSTSAIRMRTPSSFPPQWTIDGKTTTTAAEGLPTSRSSKSSNSVTTTGGRRTDREDSNESKILEGSSHNREGRPDPSSNHYRPRSSSDEDERRQSPSRANESVNTPKRQSPEHHYSNSNSNSSSGEAPVLVESPPMPGLDGAATDAGRRKLEARAAPYATVGDRAMEDLASLADDDDAAAANVIFYADDRSTSSGPAAEAIVMPNAADDDELTESTSRKENNDGEEREEAEDLEVRLGKVSGEQPEGWEISEDVKRSAEGEKTDAAAVPDNDDDDDDDELERCRRKLEDSERELKECRDERTELRVKVETLLIARAEREETFSRKLVEKDDACREEVRYAKTKADNAKLRILLWKTAAEGAAAGSKKEIDALSERNGALEEENGMLKSGGEIAALSEKNQELEEENERLSIDIRDVRKMNETLGDAADALNRRLEDARRLMEEERDAANASRATKAADAKRELEECSRRLGNALAVAEECERSDAAKAEELLKLRAELEEERQSVGNNASKEEVATGIELAELKAWSTDAYARLQELEGERTQAEATIRILEERLQAKEAANWEARREFEASLAAKDEEASDLRSELIYSVGSTSSKTMENRALQDRLVTLQERLMAEIESTRYPEGNLLIESEESKRRIKDMRDELDKNARSMEDKSTEILALREQLMAEMVSKRNSEQKFRANLRTRDEERDRLETQMTKLSEEVLALQAELVAANSAKDATASKLSELEGWRAAAEKNLEDLEASDTFKTEGIRVLRKCLEAEKASTQDTNGQVEELRAKLDEAQSAKNFMASKMSNLEAQRNDAEENLEDMKESNAAKTEEIRCLLEAAEGTARDSYNRFEEFRKNAEQDLAQAKSSYEARAIEIMDLQEKLNSKEMSMQDLEANLLAKELEVNQLKKELEELLDSTDGHRALAAEEKCEWELSVQADVQRLERELRECKCSSASKTKELRALRGQLLAKDVSNQEGVHDLEVRLHAKAGEAKMLRTQIDGISKNTNKLLTWLSGADLTKDGIISELSELKAWRTGVLQGAQAQLEGRAQEKEQLKETTSKRKKRLAKGNSKRIQACPKQLHAEDVASQKFNRGFKNGLPTKNSKVDNVKRTKSKELDDLKTIVEAESEAVDVILVTDNICQPSDALANSTPIKDAPRPKGMEYKVCVTGQHQCGVEILEKECEERGLRILTRNATEREECESFYQGFVEGMDLASFEI